MAGRDRKGKSRGRDRDRGGRDRGGRDGGGRKGPQLDISEDKNGNEFAYISAPINDGERTRAGNWARLFPSQYNADEFTLSVTTWGKKGSTGFNAPVELGDIEINTKDGTVAIDVTYNAYIGRKQAEELDDWLGEVETGAEEEEEEEERGSRRKGRDRDRKRSRRDEDEDEED